MALRRAELDLWGVLRARDLPTVPSTLAEELATNPFLRCAEPMVRSAAERVSGEKQADASAGVAAIRAWKNKF